MQPLRPIYFGAKKIKGIFYRITAAIPGENLISYLFASFLTTVLVMGPVVGIGITSYELGKHQIQDLAYDQRQEQIWDSRIEEAAESGVRADYPLKPNQPLWGPIGGHSIPEVTDIDQTNLGNCYLLAALGSLIDEVPETISDIVTTNSDGSYQVSLYHPETAEPVSLHVENLLIKNGEPRHASLDNGVAIAAIESAYNQLLNNKKIAAEQNSEELPIQVDALTGGFPKNALKILTGKETTETALTAETLPDIPEAISKGQPITVATASKEKTTAEQQQLIEKIGLYNLHVYVVTDYYQDNKGEPHVELYNPHGEYLSVKESDMVAFYQYTTIEKFQFLEPEKHTAPVQTPTKNLSVAVWYGLLAQGLTNGSNQKAETQLAKSWYSGPPNKNLIAGQVRPLLPPTAVVASPDTTDTLNLSA